MTKWNPTFGKFLKTWLEPENEFYKFAVAAEKCDIVDGHLWKRKTSRFAKTISFLLCGSNENPCKVEVTRKRVNSFLVHSWLHWNATLFYLNHRFEVTGTLHES